MNRYIKALVCILFMIFACHNTMFAQQSTFHLKYGIWATANMKMSTGELTSQVSQHFEDAVLEGNKLKIAGKTISLYNKKVKNEGFSALEIYEGMDDADQKCQVAFKSDPTEDMLKYIILVSYGDMGVMFISREPERIK